MAYRPGSSLTASPAEIARRNGISPALATSQQARAAVPAPPSPLASAAPALKGAVKVGAFPSRGKYPFREIAIDGGIWKLDPAAFGVKKSESIRAAAGAWAKNNGLTVKTVIDAGALYVQFKGGA